MVLGLALAAGLIAGCAPAETAAPSTPAPLFATEEEAFAAAEEVYRAYNDAVNRRASGDLDADPMQFVTGRAYEADLAFWRSFDQGDRRTVGESVIGSFSGVESDIVGPSARVVVDVCLDSSGVRILDLAANDVTPEDRENVSMLVIVFVFEGEGFKIADSTHRGPGEC